MAFSLKNIILLIVLILGMSAALAGMYLFTKGPIEKKPKQKETKAVQSVLPAFDNDPVLNKQTIEGLEFYLATKDSLKVGCAVRTFTENGFNGRMDLLVGFLPDGTINRIKVLSQEETPGLGAKAGTKWITQFYGKNPAYFRLAVKKDGGDVDAISSATISSRGVSDAINKAYTTYIANFCSVPDSIINTIKEVLPEFDNNPAQNVKKLDSLELYFATKDGKPAGCAVKMVSESGYNGKIVLMVGFLPDGTIHKVAVIEQKETPGLGGRITEEPDFISQFAGKNAAKCKFSVKDDKGDIDAISGATITSRACCEAISLAYDAYKSVKK